MKVIGILTSGGDAPGMNAAVRAITRVANKLGMDVFGIYHGFAGLIEDEIIRLDSRKVGDVLHRGGTFLKTARSPEFMTEEGQAKAVANIKKYGMQGLAVIGGDGSFKGALALQRHGVKVVGIPGTIDNDIPCTDYTIGFDTAINTVVDCVNKIRDTATSHERTFVVEVMGKNCGDLALHAGLAGGAEVILIPEVEPDYDAVCKKVQKSHHQAKSHAVVIVAEGVGGDPAYRKDYLSAAFHVAELINKRTGIETRVTILGHIQRGGSPTASDRLLASRLGAEAARALYEEDTGKMIAIQDGKVVRVDLDYALSQKKTVKREYLELANMLSSV
ncbi:MAG TPA: 6-phosphofructokinase [Bacillota bacterium]|nr:6-phosphofructokinase [Bacillota bacterium]